MYAIVIQTPETIVKYVINNQIGVLTLTFHIALFSVRLGLFVGMPIFIFTDLMISP